MLVSEARTHTLRVLESREATGASEDAASGRAARLGGTVVVSPSPPY
jgi:hypothetical protein